MDSIILHQFELNKFYFDEESKSYKIPYKLNQDFTRNQIFELFYYLPYDYLSLLHTNLWYRHLYEFCINENEKVYINYIKSTKKYKLMNSYEEFIINKELRNFHYHMYFHSEQNNNESTRYSRFLCQYVEPYKTECNKYFTKHYGDRLISFE